MESNLDKARKIILNPNFARLSKEEIQAIFKQILASGVTKAELGVLLRERDQVRPTIKNISPKTNVRLETEEKEQREVQLISQLNDTVNNPTFSNVDPNRQEQILERYRRDLGYDKDRFGNLIRELTSPVIQPLPLFSVSSQLTPQQLFLQRIEPALEDLLTRDPETVQRGLQLIQDAINSSNLGLSIEAINHMIRTRWGAKTRDSLPLLFGSLNDIDYIYSAKVYPNEFLVELNRYITQLNDPSMVNSIIIEGLMKRFNINEAEINDLLRQLRGGQPPPIYIPSTTLRNTIINFLNNEPLLNEPNTVLLFNVLRIRLNMSYDQLNQFLRDNYQGQGGIPQIILGPEGMIRMIRAPREQPRVGRSPTRRQEPMPRPRGEIVDDGAAVVELGDLITIVNRMAENELNRYGRHGVLMEDLQNLMNDMAPVIQEFMRAEMSGRQTNMPLAEYLAILQDWRDRLNELIRMDKALGRRCINTHTPILGEPVEEVPDNEIIRLNNGVCWDVDTLTKYIKDEKGSNDARKLRGYPSKTIWENNEDLDRILRHEISNRKGFSQWFMNRNVEENALKISNETLDQMMIAASLLASRGQPFQDAMEKELAQDPKLLAEWRRIGRNPDNTKFIGNKEIRDAVVFTIAKTLKSLAVVDFLDYFYNKISQEERNALLQIEPTLEKNLAACKVEGYCVFGMARDLQTVRNQIAGVKGLPFIDLDPDIE